MWIGIQRWLSHARWLDIYCNPVIENRLKPTKLVLPYATINRGEITIVIDLKYDFTFACARISSHVVISQHVAQELSF
jgi:hypothetical protein